MNLKNYTSEVPANVTIGRIQSKLIEARVNSLNMDYGPNGEVVALTFAIQIEADKRPVQIRIPANVEAAQQTLWLDYAGTDKLSADGERLAWSPRKQKVRADFLQQGERTAWKIVQDWVEVQFAMIQLRQADFMQVFLPYAWDGQQSFYHRLKAGGFAALLPPKDETSVVVES